ncbi:MAG: hypothetical protein AB1782_12250 [Cyanobacteriota bacterium]
MKKKYIGNALSQYGIIIALIFLAILPVFLFTGKNIVSYFNSLYQGLKHNQNISTNKESSASQTNNAQKIELIKAGSLGGTQDEPVSTCNDNLCNIDYGEFVLKGVPENFNGFVQASGTSGGTEELLALIEQIAQQLEEKGDTEGAKEYRELANLGHFVADVENIVETSINSCTNSSGDGYNSDCVKKELNKMYFDPPKTPDNVQHLLPDFNMNNFTFWDFTSFMDIDDAIVKMKYGLNYNQIRNGEIEFSDDYSEASKADYYKTSKPSYAMATKYIQIMKNPAYSDTMKSVTTQLIKNIAVLGDELAYNASQQESNHAAIGLQSVDWESGKVITQRQSQSIETCYPGEGCSSSSPSEIKKHEYSMKTDLNSALICSTGKNRDKNNNCN